MNRFLRTYDLQKLNEEAIYNLNMSIMSNKIEAVIKKFSPLNNS